MKKLFFLMVSLLCFASCHNLVLRGERNVHVVLPNFQCEFNENCPRLIGWSVEIRSEKRENVFFVEDNEFNIVLDDGEIGFLLAFPIVENVYDEKLSFFKPAGLVFQDGIDESEVLLDWYKGYTAFVMKVFIDECKKDELELEEVWNYTGCFNWHKLDLTVEEKILEYDCIGSLYNPWLTSPETVTKCIALHSFRGSYLSMKNYYEFENLNNNEIYSSFVPENKNIEKNHKILIKQSEVNLISDYNLNAIIVSGTSAENAKIKNCRMPFVLSNYE